MSSATLVKEIPLISSKKGVITVSHLPEAYGIGSESVVSIGISLSGNSGEPTWKAHIPYENLDEVIAAMIESRDKFSK